MQGSRAASVAGHLEEVREAIATLHLVVLGAVLLQQAQSLSDYASVDATFRLNSEGKMYCSSVISTDCKEGSFSGVGYLRAGDDSFTASLKASIQAVEATRAALDAEQAKLREGVRFLVFLGISDFDQEEHNRRRERR